jgi:glycosyltransferase involved in cell wall biosynthesis
LQKLDCVWSEEQVSLTSHVPSVSVIIPAYNRSVLLAEAIDSVRSQTYTDFEIIVVDDGSTDDTPSLAESRDLRYIRIEHTGMPGLIRNQGAAQARGKLLAFLDSDDLWTSDKLSRQLLLHGCDTTFGRAEKNIPITHTREQWLRNGKVISQSKLRHKRSGNLFEDSLVKCIIGPSTVVMDASLFKRTKGFRDDLEIGEDYEYWLRITPDAEVGYVDLPLTVKRAGHGDQLTEKYGHIEYFRIPALKDLVDSRFYTGPRLTAARRELARKCGIYAAGARKRGKTQEAERYEIYALEYAQE